MTCTICILKRRRIKDAWNARQVVLYVTGRERSSAWRLLAVGLTSRKGENSNLNFHHAVPSSITRTASIWSGQDTPTPSLFDRWRKLSLFFLPSLKPEGGEFEFNMRFTKTNGRAIAQAVSRRIPFVADWIRFQVISHCSKKLQKILYRISIFLDVP